MPLRPEDVAYALIEMNSMFKSHLLSELSETHVMDASTDCLL
jgi:hypothetical protein